ncbi:unnamed protein product, partial [Adineta ricciae]
SKSVVNKSDIIKKIIEYKCTVPSAFAWEIREHLIREMNYNLEDLPNVSAIHRLLQNLDLTLKNMNSEEKPQVNETNCEYYQVLLDYLKANNRLEPDLFKVQNEPMILTKQQKDTLEEIFNVTHYPDLYQRERLGIILNLPEAKIQVEMKIFI